MSKVNWHMFRLCYLEIEIIYLLAFDMLFLYLVTNNWYFL